MRVFLERPHVTRPGEALPTPPLRLPELRVSRLWPLRIKPLSLPRAHLFPALQHRETRNRQLCARSLTGVVFPDKQEHGPAEW